MSASSERVALYDPADPIGRVVGEAARSQVRAENLPHAATGILIRDAQGRVLLHRRSRNKDLWPALIDAAAGGVLGVGETPLACARRELAEELGITGVDPIEVGTIWFQNSDAHYLSHFYEVQWDGPVVFSDGEVEAAWWVQPQELSELLEQEPSRAAMVPDTHWILRRLRGVSPDPQRWSRGEAVLVRFGRRGRVHSVRTARVLLDDDRGLVLWVPADTATVITVRVDGQDLRTLPVAERSTAPWARRLSRWHGPGIYQWFPPRYAGWSLWSFFAPDGTFRGWYGNLESPPIRRRTLDGTHLVDVADRALDVSIPLVAGQARPRWKDEDEFMAFTDLPGRWTAAQAEQIRLDGWRLWLQALRGAWPFDGHWIVPPTFGDPLHRPVEIPTDWDVPHVGGP